MSDEPRPDDPEIVDNPGGGRFESTIDGRVAELVYRLEGDRLVLVHTGVPGELEGRGIGGALVRYAVEHARRHELTLVPQCPFARTWLEKHPDVASAVGIDWPART